MPQTLPVVLHLFAALHHGGAGDEKIAELGKREDAEGQGDERQALPEIEAVHGPAQGARLRVRADHGQHHAKATCGEAAQRGVARKHRDHRDAEHRQRQQFWRADEQDQRTHERQGDGHEDGAEEAADERRHIGGAERSGALAAFGHRITIQRRGCGSRMARGAEHDGGDRVAMGRRGGQAQQQRHRGGRIHAVGEGEQKRRSSDAADAGQNPQSQAGEHAAPQQRQAVRLHNDAQALRKGVKPINHLGTFRVVDPQGRIPGHWERKAAQRRACCSNPGSPVLRQSIRAHQPFLGERSLEAVQRTNRRRAGRRSFPT